MMAISVFDLSTIFWATILDVIIDLIVFKLFRIRGITFFITLLLNFAIPYLSFWALISSRPPIEQQISALADFIDNWIVNVVNFTVSGIFGYIITALIFIFSGRRTQKPEF
jgi:hypothetical protein